MLSSFLQPFLTWYLAVTLAGWLALPLAYRFFRRLPDRGYAFAKSLGLLAVVYVFWLLGSLGFLRNESGSLLLAAVLVGGLGLAWLRRQGLGELLEWVSSQRRAVLAVELVFLVAFAGWALVRAYNPDIFGTEKPMEYMFVNAILRSPGFPPQDAWLSGHAISYYYFGYLLVAALVRLTGVTASTGFNLALALLFALAAVGSLGVVMNLIALVQRGREARAGEQAPRLLSAFWPALAGPLLVLLVGNFYGVLALAHQNGLFSGLRIPAVWYSFGQADASGSSTVLENTTQSPGIRLGLVGLWEWLDLKALVPPPPRPAEFQWELGNWFYAARVVHDRNLLGVETEAIDETPAFSFLLGDLHPHVLGLPFAILAIALALDWCLWGREAAIRAGREGSFRWPSLPRLLVSGVLLGALSFLNTWDFPIYWFLTAAALVLGLASGCGWEALLRNWRPAALLAGALLLSGVLLYFPFYLTLQTQANGVLPNFIYPTRFQQTAVMFGPLLPGALLFLAWGAWRGRSWFDRRVAVWAGLGIPLLLASLLAGAVLLAFRSPEAQTYIDAAISPLSRAQAVSLGLQRRLVEGLSTLVPALVIGLSAGLAAGAARRADLGNARPPQGDFASPAVLAALTMFLTGALLLIGPEFLYLRDNFGTRMNTLFKFYYQIWVLWALALAFGAWLLFQRAGRRMAATAGIVLGACILGGLFYLAMSLPAKTNGFAGPPELDGMAYFARDYPDDWAAIQWLDENAAGQPVILEGSRGAYWVEGRSSRFSMATGLPTLLGWANHEGQWRGRYFAQVAGREEDIRQIYTLRDWEETRALLDTYQVAYILVSPTEWEWYGSLYLPKFERNLLRVFQSGEVSIYQVGGREVDW